MSAAASKMYESVASHKEPQVGILALIELMTYKAATRSDDVCSSVRLHLGSDSTRHQRRSIGDIISASGSAKLSDLAFGYVVSDGGLRVRWHLPSARACIAPSIESTSWIFAGTVAFTA